VSQGRVARQHLSRLSVGTAVDLAPTSARRSRRSARGTSRGREARPEGPPRVVAPQQMTRSPPRPSRRPQADRASATRSRSLRRRINNPSRELRRATQPLPDLARNRRLARAFAAQAVWSRVVGTHRGLTLPELQTKTPNPRGFSERMMGLEPTTVCMARTGARSPCRSRSFKPLVCGVFALDPAFVFRRGLRGSGDAFCGLLAFGLAMERAIRGEPYGDAYDLAAERPWLQLDAFVPHERRFRHCGTRGDRLRRWTNLACALDIPTSCVRRSPSVEGCRALHSLFTFGPTKAAFKL
jgi:hypothetical protein